MVSTFSGKITAFPDVAGAATLHSSRLEEEVVSLFDQLRVPVLRYLLSFRLPVPDAEGDSLEGLFRV